MTTETNRRTPRVHERVSLYGDRLTILAIKNRGNGPLIVTEDDGGMRIERYADRLTWDAKQGCWVVAGARWTEAELREAWGR